MFDMNGNGTTDASQPSGCLSSDLVANLSAYDFPSPHELAKPLSWYEYIKIALYLVILVLALMGNVSVVLTVILNRSMRTTINCYLVNLAVADLLICVFCMWVPLVNNLTAPMFVLGAFMCKFNSFAQMTCLTSSVLTLSAVAIDRVKAILFPLHVHITKQRTDVVISLVWILSASVAVPFLVFNKHAVIQWRDIQETQCIDDWPKNEIWNEHLHTCVVRYPTKQFYYTFVTVTLYLLPVVIMTTTYSWIICKLWRTELPGERSVANINVQHRAMKKVIKMVCAVLIGFVFCWTPLQITVLYSQFGHASEMNGELPAWFNTFSYISTFLAYSNSALNPILYGGFNDKFRRGLFAVLRCSCTDPQFVQQNCSQKTRNTTMSRSAGGCEVNGSHREMAEFPMKQLEASSTNG